VKLILDGNNQELGLENLEGMLKILPDSTEIEVLKCYQGDLEKLGEAEKFIITLIQVPK
jgi:inverted formin-2